MKIHLLIAMLFVGLVSCKTKSKEDTVTREMEIKDLKLNDVVHDSLTTKQIKAIERILRTFSEVNSNTLEETIDNFKRDQRPDREIAVWLTMADVYEHFTLHKGTAIDHNKKDEAYELILLRSMMTEEEVIDKFDFKYLSTDEVKAILDEYADPPQLLRVE